MKKKVFVYGAALDSDEDVDRVANKIKWCKMADQLKNKAGMPVDPYDLFVIAASEYGFQCKPVGKLSIDSWLTPIPHIGDLKYITPLNFFNFINNGGCLVYSTQVEKAAQELAEEGIPLLIGIDHSLSGGAIKGILSKKSDNIKLIVIDAHYDGIPYPIRKKLIDYARSKKLKGGEYAVFLDDVKEEEINDSYNCGSYIDFLIREKIIDLNSIAILGVADQPDKSLLKNNDPQIKEYIKQYYKYNMVLMNKHQISNIKEFGKSIKQWLGDNPDVYISVDIDIGASVAHHGSRFLSPKGLSEYHINRVIGTIKEVLIECNSNIIGMDICEFDFHRAGLKYNGERDKTYDIAVKIAGTLLQ